MSYYIFFINIFLASIIIFTERKRPIYTLFWIMLLIYTSYIGFIIYIFFGLGFKKRRLLKKKYDRSFIKKTKFLSYLQYNQLVKMQKIISFLESSSNSKLTLPNKMRIFSRGDEYFEILMKDLESARETIHMEYYIFKDDCLGQQFYNLLIKKAKEGVSVRIILDGTGTRDISRKRLKELRANGISFEIFFPSYLPFLSIGNLRANYRNHRKLALIDSYISYTGGFNIGNEYLGKGTLGNWRDLGIRFEGPITIEFEKEFIINWGFLKGKKNNDYNFFIKKILSEEKKLKELPPESILPLQVFSSAPIYDIRTVRDNVLGLIAKASKSICITTPYFIPDDLTFDALKMASLAGIEIKIAIPSVPDHYFVYWANQSFISELLPAGVSFYRYRDGFLHSKMIIVDDEVASVGTANFDYRSFYQNFEINVNIYSHKEVLKLKKEFLNILKDSDEIILENFKKRSRIEIFKESICRLFSPIL